MQLPGNWRRYGLSYCTAYIVSFAVLVYFQKTEVWVWPADGLAPTLSEIATASFGVAFWLAIILELGVYMVLFAPSKARELREEGRQQGLKEGREEGRKEALKELQLVIDSLTARIAEVEQRLEEAR